MYNQYNPEANNNSSPFENLIKVFKCFLDSEKISKGSVRSYTSDVRHFLGWLLFFLKSNKILTNLSPTIEQSNDGTIILLKHVNQKVLISYKDYLLSNNTPLKTINRRFSSLRRFGQFCKSQGWLSLNPFEILRNFSQNQPFPENEYHLAEYRAHLWKNNSSKATIKNYLNDVKQFLSWVDSQDRKQIYTDPRKSVPNPRKSETI